MLTSLIGIIASSGGAPAAGGAYESIATVTASGSETSLTFSSIAGTYASLQIRGLARRNSTSAASMRIRFNSDSGNNYASHTLSGNGSAIEVGSSTSANGLGAATSYFFVPSNDPAFGAMIIDIHNYASTTQNKTTRIFTGWDSNGGTPAGRVILGSGLWISTSAITSVTITLDGDVFGAGSTFALYGIKGA
jgi:hypothetical protein